MASGAVVRRVAAVGSKVLVAAKAAGGNVQQSPPITASHILKKFFTESTLPVPSPKILLEVSGKMMPACEAGAPKIYEMSVLAGTEDEVVHYVRKFTALLRTNDPEMLYSFCTKNEVTLTEVKESIYLAATEVKKQAFEHTADVKAEINALKAALSSSSEELNLVKGSVAAVGTSVGRLEEEAKKFTVHKLLSYASVLSLGNLLGTWGVSEYVLSKARGATPPSDQIIDNLPSA